MFCLNCGVQLPAGALRCPRCGAPLQGGQEPPSPASMPGHGAWASLLFVCAVLAAAAYAVSALRPPAPDAPARGNRISAVRLAAAFRENEAAAELRWKGLAVEVSGTVVRVDVIFGSPNVELEDGVTCRMDRSLMDEAARLRPGQAVTVIGRVGDRVLGGVSLRNCRVAEAGKAQESPLDGISGAAGALGAVSGWLADTDRDQK